MGIRKIYKLDGKPFIINKRANAGQRMYLQSTKNSEEWMVEKRLNGQGGLKYKYVKAIDLGSSRTKWVPANFKVTDKKHKIEGKQKVRQVRSREFTEE